MLAHIISDTCSFAAIKKHNQKSTAAPAYSSSDRLCISNKFNLRYVDLWYLDLSTGTHFKHIRPIDPTPNPSA